MKKKFTEGEWVVDGDLICLGFNPSDAVICDINPYLDEYISVFEYSEQEARANEKLIAAAPDMLGALLETDKDLCVLESTMAQIESTDPRAEGMTELVKKWRERNKLAIKKATE